MAKRTDRSFGVTHASPHDAAMEAYLQQVGLRVANGTKITCDLHIGADGAWSKVRPLVSGAKPGYTGTCFIETFLSANEPRHRASADAIGGGTLLANPGDIETALAAYEEQLFPQSERFARETAQNLERFFDDTAPHSVVDLFSRHAA